MSLGRKKVILRSLNGDWQAGYLPSANFALRDGVELLDLAGKVRPVDLSQVKWLCFVRDFNSGEPGNPERLLRKSFAGRPRSEGVWLRLRLKDGEPIEGLAANDLSLIDPAGVFLTPPDIRSNTQRIFIPRSAIASLEFVAVIGRPFRRKITASPKQEDLFSSSE